MSYSWNMDAFLGAINPRSISLRLFSSSKLHTSTPEILQLTPGKKSILLSDKLKLHGMVN